MLSPLSTNACDYRYEQMKKNNGGVDPIIEQYSDLEGINCILILCEKGRMGTCVMRFVPLLPLMSQ
jgi:hypothetical protein